MPGCDTVEKKIQDEHWSRNKRHRRSPDHPVVSATYEPLADIVASSVENAKNASVLDVGCGNGFLQWALQHRLGEVAGLDYSEQMLEINPCQRKFVGCSTNLPFDDRSFDIVVAAHLLHHLPEKDRIRTLNEMKRVARYAVVSFEPNRTNPLNFLFALVTKEEQMALIFSQSYMRMLFRRIGLISVSIHVENWNVPNKAPLWWIPLGALLGKSYLCQYGFDICSVAALHRYR